MKPAFLLQKVMALQNNKNNTPPDREPAGADPRRVNFALGEIMNLSIYEASLENSAYIQALISKSARILQVQYYKKPEIETALELVSGIEELIAAGNFLVAEYENIIIGCGGWAIDVSEPKKAEIRGFFVHPDFARRGVATYLFIACENECLRKGIEGLYLTATLSGEPFYKKCGFSEVVRFKQGLSNGETFELVKMEKQLQNLTAGTRL